MSKLTDLKAKTIVTRKAPLAIVTTIGLKLIFGNRKGRGKWVLRHISPTAKSEEIWGSGHTKEHQSNAQDKLSRRRVLTSNLA